MTARPRYHLLTAHGTLLARRKADGVACNLPLLDIGDDHEIVTLSPIFDLGAWAGTMVGHGFDGIFQPGFVAQSVALQSSTGYWTAQPDGRLTCATDACRRWESFLPLSSGDVATLRRLMLRSSGIRMGQHFWVQVGGSRVYLPDNLPLAPGWGGDESDRAAPAQKAVWIDALGNAGNRALQYLAAEGIRALVPGAVVQNITLPEWGMVAPHPPPPPASAVRTGARYWIDTPGLADCLRRGVVDTVILDGYPFNIRHFPSRPVARALLGPTLGGREATGFGAGELVCSVRAGEVLTGLHRNYFPLPPAYYRMLAERSGLDLVFFGQLGDDPYSASLREAFPDARFVPGRNPQYDFDMLRRSAHIAPSLSTFAWLAAWLSEAESVYLPVGGLFSPIQSPGHMFLPLDDPSYRYTLLPFSHAVNLWKHPDAFAAQQEHVGRAAQPVSAAELSEICARVNLLAPHELHVGGFDPAFYLATYPQVAAELAGAAQSALEHYTTLGIQQNKKPLHLEEDFYLRQYPDAAMAISRGMYRNVQQHYMSYGWANSYWPNRSSMEARDS